MHRLSQLALLLWVMASGFLAEAQNPHGPSLKIDCKDCHTTGSWTVDLSKVSFKHDETSFPLEDRHAQVACADCHKTLDFSEASDQCIDCHLDVHEMSAGNDCERCHTAKNWLVQDISGIHEQNGFMLEGAHVTVSCVDCHKSGNSLVWERMGNRCIDCHEQDMPASGPFDHITLGFGTACTDCHSPFSPVWNADFYHEFFPLTKGHSGVACIDCHLSTPFTAVSPECISCHQEDYDNTNNPNHAAIGIGTDCIACHTTDVGWTPVDYGEHDLLFPIYSGKHKGEWGRCTDCHTDPGNYAVYNCLQCHEHNDPDELARIDDHDDPRYRYESTACFECHPRGD